MSDRPLTTGEGNTLAEIKFRRERNTTPRGEDVDYLLAECGRLREQLKEESALKWSARKGRQEAEDLADRLREQLDAARQALKAICESTDSGPWIVEYRAAGGGYEGLQAIARAALGVEGPAG